MLNHEPGMEIRPEALPGKALDCGCVPEECLEWDGSECENCEFNIENEL